MKKLLIVTNLLLLAIIFFLACGTNKENPIPVKESCAEISTTDYRNPELSGEIDARLAQRMSEAYANDSYKGFLSAGDSARRKRDALCIWFEIGKLKHFISLIENSVCGRKCKDPMNLGIRIYYAKYPANTGTREANEDLRGMPGIYAGKHTVFMVPTYDKGKGNHIDFDPTDIGDDKCLPTPYTELLKKPGAHKIIGLNRVNWIIRSGGDTTTNHGDLMPPPDGAGTFPTGDN